MSSADVAKKLAARNFTASDVERVLRGRVEPADPADAVLELFKREAGKPFTKRILAKLPGGEENWRIDTHTGMMTHLTTRDYARTSGREGVSFLVSYETKGVVIDPAFLEKHNPGFFGARRERNEARGRVLEKPEAMEEMAGALREVCEARTVLAKAEERLGRLTEFGADFSPDQYEWEKLCGEEE